MKALRFLLVAVSALGMLLPSQAVLAANPSTPDARPPAARPQSTAAAELVRDVTLEQGGVLRGAVVNAQGVPLAKAPVSVVHEGRPQAQTVTGADGRFAVSGLRGGVYQISSGRGVGTFRAWTANSAPPAAQPAALIVDGPQVFRGQRPIGQLFTSDLFIISAIVAAAIAIPVAIHNSRNDDDSGS